MVQAQRKYWADQGDSEIIKLELIRPSWFVV